MNALTTGEVVAFLQANPGFFEQNADLLATLYVPHPHGGRTISLNERQLLVMREANRKLESKLAELIAFGEENDAISEKVHRLALALLAAPGFSEAIHLIYTHLQENFAVPHVALRLWGCPADADLPECAQTGEELRAFAETLTQPYCGATAGFGIAAWFGEQAEHVRSQALIALRDGGATLGMIALGSEETQRFYAGMGTLYLEHLGELASAALARLGRAQ